MSTLLQTFDLDTKNQSKNSKSINITNEKYHGHVLQSKNIFKPKCNKALKRKLKKYRLRKDGKEDEEVLDVSQILLAALKIKSPSNQNLLNGPETKLFDNENHRPKNYLFKMARKKLKIKKTEATTDVTIKNQKDIKSPSVSQINESPQKKKTNAFKLMMDSRNKSIGSNSPGKEDSTNVPEIQEIVKKKEIKTKRHLALQKMAEEKGSIKRRELEEQKDKCVERKMEKRAERLRSMIMKNDSNKEKNKKDYSPDAIIILDKTAKVSSDTLDTENNKVLVPHAKTLELINIFSNVNAKHQNDAILHKKNVLDEDEEFLKKLSPSLKKKENMLCYFKKIEKTCELSPPDNGNSLVKVKVTSKRKNKLIKKRLSLTKEDSSEVLKHQNEKESVETQSAKPVIEIINGSSSSNERKKRKRKENTLDTVYEKQVTIDPIETEKRRPKRSIRKPVKYIDDVELSSSDEELHIFTPKKRKNFDNKTKHSSLKEICAEILNISDEETTTAYPNRKKKIERKVEALAHMKSIKLAPIFATKPQLNLAELEAKQKFLYSGVPDKLKKIIAQQKNVDTEISMDFPVVVHVQQKKTTESIIQSFIHFDLHDDDSDEELVVEEKKGFFSKLLSISEEINNRTIPVSKINTHTVLKNIKELYPKFPVYRTYRLLKGKGKFRAHDFPDLENSIEIVSGMTDIIDENPDCLNWTDKYKAMSSNHLIGNFESIKALKKWLITWTENDLKAKNTVPDSDSSDFYESDTDSRDFMKTTNNLLILTGPVGSGKTSSVYAVAAELAIKVIEVNASSKRTGKVMLQDLQEATQSHKVNRGSGSAENSQKSQELLSCPAPRSIKKKGRPKKTVTALTIKHVTTQRNEILSQPTASQDSVRTCMSLILIDDADIVFDQDDGFSSAVAQLIQCSKRPVIIVAKSLACPHLHRFTQCGKIMNLSPLLPRMLGTWLDILCLADNGTCWPGLGAKFLDFFKGDIRKTINCLQFYMTTQTQDSTLDEETASQISDYCNSDFNEDNSSMSWADEVIEERNTFYKIPVNLDTDAWKYFMDTQSNLLHIGYSLDLFNVWWSVPRLFKGTFERISQPEYTLIQKNIESNLELSQALESIADILDTISISDYISQIKPDTRSNLISQPWYRTESDSVSEQESLENYNRSHEVSTQILKRLVTSSVVEAQRKLQSGSNTDIHFPSMAVYRERDKILSRHENLTSFLSPSSALDRRALALDYWPACRSICRIEKTKTDCFFKRNNRFCHYLKSLNATCKNDSFDKLCDSLCSSGK